MVTPDQAHRQLAGANPAPTLPVTRPSASEFLESVSTETIRLRQPSRRRDVLRGPVIAFAVFLVVLLAGALVVTLSSTEGDVADTVPLPPTSIPEQSTVTTLSEIAGRAEELAMAYSSGDFASVKGLLGDGATYGWTRMSDFVAGPVLWTEEDFRARYEIDAALNTNITLTECQDLAAGRVSCAILRVDDLTRARRLEPSPDVRWRLTIEDGQVIEWTHHTPDVSAYYAEAREPFHDWLAATHPEVENPATDLRGQPWRADTEFAEIAADLVAEYAASLGVDLER